MKKTQPKKQPLQKKVSHSNIGKWVERKTKTEILICICGGKYLKTRKDQTICIRCMFPVRS